MADHSVLQQQPQHMPWVMFYGAKGSSKKSWRRGYGHAGTIAFRFDPTQAEQGTLDDLLRRAQREALLRGAVLYIGPLRGDLLNDNGRELIKRIISYPSMLVLGVEQTQPPRMTIDHSMQEVQLSIPPEPSTDSLAAVVPESIRAKDLSLESIARAFTFRPAKSSTPAKKPKSWHH